MATTVWKGYLAFGLVSIPVRLFRAARAERVPLKQLYRRPKSAPVESEPAPEEEPVQDHERTEAFAPVRKVYEGADGAEEVAPIAPADLVKGYEYEKGRYVVVDEEEVRSLAPATTTEMQIVEFVRFEQVDPIYLETSYYLIPEESGEKAYALLFEAMRDTGYAAIGQLVMHRRDHVVIVRTGRTGLLAHTMFYPDEVRATQEFRVEKGVVAAKELHLAKSLIQALATPFDPGKFKNNFRERLRELIEARVAEQPMTALVASKPAKVVDIMDALRRSLAETGGAPKAEKKPAREQRSERKERRRSG